MLFFRHLASRRVKKRSSRCAVIQQFKKIVVRSQPSIAARRRAASGTISLEGTDGRSLLSQKLRVAVLLILLFILADTVNVVNCAFASSARYGSTNQFRALSQVHRRQSGTKRCTISSDGKRPGGPASFDDPEAADHRPN